MQLVSQYIILLFSFQNPKYFNVGSRKKKAFLNFNYFLKEKKNSEKKFYKNCLKTFEKPLSVVNGRWVK